MVRIRSFGQPEQATISAFVETTESKRARDPSSPVSSEDGNPFRHTVTRQSSWPLQNLSDINRLVPRPQTRIAFLCSAGRPCSKFDRAVKEIVRRILTVIRSSTQSKLQRAAWWSVKELIFAHKFRRTDRSPWVWRNSPTSEPESWLVIQR